MQENRLRVIMTDSLYRLDESSRSSSTSALICYLILGGVEMSYTNLLYHIVYATKSRAPLITRNLKSDLPAYLGGIVRGLDCVPIEINGMAEHVHLLVRIRPTIAVSDFLSKLKSSSSLWAKKTKGRFAWQAKYGAFTGSESQVGRVRQYIQDQEKHHLKASFEQEFEALLSGNRIDFDRRYLWA